MTKEEIRQKMHLCVEEASKNITKWNKEGPAVPDLTWPVVSKEHLHSIVEWVYENYKERIEEENAKDQVYYIHIDDSPIGHPIYYIGTFMTLFMAGAKKIWIEYSGCYEPEGSRFISDMPADQMIKVIAEHFSDRCFLRRNVLTKNEKREVIEFVNSTPEVTHVVQMGNQYGSYWRMGRYRKDVLIHTPTSNKVWIDYKHPEDLQKDRNLFDFGDHCWEEAFNYECFYSSRSEETYSRDVYVWMDYEDQWNWADFAKEERKWKEEHPNYVDSVPIYLFGDEEAIETCMKDMPDCLVPITKETFSLEKIFYDFTNLF